MPSRGPADGTCSLRTIVDFAWFALVSPSSVHHEGYVNFSSQIEWPERDINPPKWMPFGHLPQIVDMTEQFLCLCHSPPDTQVRLGAFFSTFSSVQDFAWHRSPQCWWWLQWCSKLASSNFSKVQYFSPTPGGCCAIMYTRFPLNCIASALQVSLFAFARWTSQ